MVAAAVSLFVLIHPPGPHLPALAFVLLFPSSFGLRSRSLICVLVPIHLCLLGCLPIQPPCGLHLHSFVLTRPTYSCLFLSRLTFVRACSFVCLSPFVCASPCIRALVPVFIWALFMLICAHLPRLFVFVPIFVWPSFVLICTRLFVLVPVFVWSSLGLVRAPWPLIYAYIKYTIS